MTVNRLPPPPRGLPPEISNWLNLVFDSLGRSSGNSPLNSDNITGVLESQNLVPGAGLNRTNNITILPRSDGAGADAYGPGGIGSAGTLYRNKVAAGSIEPAGFEGLDPTTFYYAAWDVDTQSWDISQSYVDVTGDNQVVFAFQTTDAGGVGGTSGGGGTGSGGDGGIEPGSGLGGRGVLA